MTTKYVIELGDDVQFVAKVGVTASGNAYSLGEYKADLEELNSDYINGHFSKLLQDAHDTGYKEGYAKKVEVMFDGEYQRGLEDGKAVNDKGCEGCKYANVAGTHEPCVRCSNSYGNQWTAKDDKIEVGDEVYCKGDDESDSGVVTWVGKDRVCAMWQDGSAGEVQKDELIKTGRHFDIKSILEEMRYD